MQKITPFLWFDGNAEEAVGFYTSKKGGGLKRPFSVYLASLVLVCGACKSHAPKATDTSSKAAVSAPASAVEPVRKAPENACQLICEKTKGLNCDPGNACAADCEKLRQGATCINQFEAFLTCLLTQPVEHFECAGAPTPGIREGYCDHERLVMDRCMITSKK